MFTRKIGIDLGTANTIVFVPKRGFVINEPTVVAMNIRERKVIAVGKEAKEMVGRTPEDIVPYHPLREGVIADYYITKAMLKYFIRKATGSFNVFKPEIVISVPAGITQTERRAVVNAAKEAGAREAHVVREPILAALGAGIPINSASGNMIVNIGGGTAEVAVVALGGIVSWASIRVAGNKFDAAIMDYIKKKYSLSIGEQMAERIKIEIGAALPSRQKREFRVRGRDIASGLPRDVALTSNEIAEALNVYLVDIATAVQNVFNDTPPELVADVMDKGIILSGGGVQIAHMAAFFKSALGVNAYVAEEPLFCVAKGTGLILTHLDIYKRALLSKH